MFTRKHRKLKKIIVGLDFCPDEYAESLYKILYNQSKFTEALAVKRVWDLRFNFEDVHQFRALLLELTDNYYIFNEWIVEYKNVKRNLECL